MLALMSMLLAAPVAGDDACVTVIAIADDGADAGSGVAVDVDLGSAHGRTPAVLCVPPGAQALHVGHAAAGVVDLAPGAVVDVVVHVGVSGWGAVDVVGADTAAVGAAATAAAAAAETSETGALRVRARSLLDGSAVAGASVSLRGRGTVGVVDDAGVLVVDGVAAGGADLAVVAAGFAPVVVHADVVAGGSVDVDVALAPVADALDELTVRAPFVRGGAVAAVEAERSAKAVVEVVGREAMQKTGDSDAASALRRVTGLTVVGGRFVYVRGLGDRYSSTLLNGAPLPSPEPERRVVPLDLFPAQLLDSVVVQKTWTAPLAGEFGGGSVQLVTRGSSGHTEPFATVSLSSSWQLGVTGTAQQTVPGGAFDLVGVDDGSRAVPADVAAATADGPLAEGNALTGKGVSRAELETLGEQLGARPWSPSTTTLLPALSVQGAAGTSIDTPLGELAVVGALLWAEDATRTDTTRTLTTGSGDSLTAAETLDVSAVEQTVNSGGVLGLAWSPSSGQRIRAVTFFNRDASNEARIATGHDEEIDAGIIGTRLRTLYRQLLVQQLAGEHRLGAGFTWAPFSEAADVDNDPADDAAEGAAESGAIDDDNALTLHWRASYALAQREEPGMRSSRYDEGQDGVYRLSDRSDGNQLLWSSLVDHAGDAQVDVTAPVVVDTGDGVVDGSVQVGVAGAAKLRTVDTRRFKFIQTGAKAADPVLRALPLDDILVEQNIGADGFTVVEATRNTDNHDGHAVSGAGFVHAEAGLGADVVVTAGLRVEASQLRVNTFELFNAAATPVVAELNTLDALPALGVTWTIVDDLTLKSAVARTVVRPELRELSPALYTDVAGGRARFGNPELEETTIVHADTRLEWALSPEDGVAVALFGKQFTKPIESVVTAGADQAITAENVDGAVNVGVEVEGRVGVASLGLAPLLGDVPVARGLWVAGNGALIASQVQIGAEQQGTLTSSERPLEGQSPWVANVQVGVDDDVFGDALTSSLALLYNVAGPRIVEVGALGLPDVYEQPVHQLDLVVRQRLPWNLALSLRAQNLLDAPATRTQGGLTVEDVRRGRTITAGLSWAL